MTEQVDWNATATMLERDDSGSDLDMHFKTVAKAPLGELVAKVVAMTPADRARILIDRGPAGTIAIAEIMALATRDDFPGA